MESKDNNAEALDVAYQSTGNAAAALAAAAAAVITANAALAAANAAVITANAALAAAASAVPTASVQYGVTPSLPGGAGNHVTVATANITPGSVIVPIRMVFAGLAEGALVVAAVVPGAPGSFEIHSSDVTDNSQLSWLVIG